MLYIFVYLLGQVSPVHSIVNAKPLKECKIRSSLRVALDLSIDNTIILKMSFKIYYVRMDTGQARNLIMSLLDQ
jgi:hypothetical protein